MMDPQGITKGGLGVDADSTFCRVYHLSATHAFLKQLARSVAVMLVEQHLELALGAADHAYVLDRRRVVLHGPATATRYGPKLLQYLAR
jgi:ABC-type branched-subunit amino acid transport system ATPase component